MVVTLDICYSLVIFGFSFLNYVTLNSLAEDDQTLVVETSS